MTPFGPMIIALIIGAGAGVLGYAAGMPLPWMLGSMMGVTVAALMRAPIRGPDRLRGFVIPVIGVMLGSAVDAGTFGQMGQWTVTLVILPLALACVAGVSYSVYRRVGGYDPVTAFYSAMPGGLNEMLLLGAAAGGDERRIALAHAARVLLVIFLVAMVFGIFFGISTTGGTGWQPLGSIGPLDYLILGACAVLGVPMGKVMRLPAAPVFGPMLLSGAAHILGWVTVAPPTLFVISAQIVIGTIIGCRFIGTTLRELGRDLSLAALSASLMLAVAGGVAATTAWLVGMPLGQVFLAFAPGGLTEMSLLTLAIDQDVAFVSVIHLIRITLVIAIAPTVFTAVRRVIVPDR